MVTLLYMYVWPVPFIHHAFTLLSLDVARGVPEFDMEAGRFKGGVDTNYMSHFKSECENKSAEKPYDVNGRSDEDDGSSESDRQKTENERSEPRRHPRIRYTSKKTDSVPANQK